MSIALSWEFCFCAPERKNLKMRSRKFTTSSLSHRADSSFSRAQKHGYKCRLPAEDHWPGVCWERISRILDSLAIPVLPAPMAGGPTTPQEVNAADADVRLGTYAGGYSYGSEE